MSNNAKISNNPHVFLTELAAFLEEKEVNDPDGGKTPKEMLREKIATIKKLLDENNNPRVFPIALAAPPEERQVNDADDRKPPKEEIKEKIAMIKKLLDDISSLAEICGGKLERGKL